MPTKPCTNCGSAFEFEPVKYEGRVIYEPERCPACVARLTNDREAKAARDAETARIKEASDRWAKICPPLYAATDPARLPQESLRRVMAWQFGPRGLVIHGPTGTGKTRAAFLLLRRLHDERRRIVAFHGNSFSHLCARKFFDGTGEGWISDLCRADVVFFDDLGKDRATDRVEAELFGLVEMRTAHLRPIISTTNFIGDSLADKLTDDRGAPLVRRLREFCDAVAFNQG